MRKHYVDNLRTIVILLLFPFHTLRMFTASDPFYIESNPNLFADIFISITSIWFMNLLFLLAGMSTAFSLEKRSIKQYSTERVKKLLIPFIFGVLLTIPIQTYYAERFHNGYTGGFFEQYRLFFTKTTDLAGYRGGLTPAHLWFLLFLFLISFLSMPVILYIKKNGRRPLKKEPSIWVLILFFLLIYVASIIELGGEALGQYLMYFLLGYLVCIRDDVLLKIKMNKWCLTLTAIPLTIISSDLFSLVNLDDAFAIPALLASALRHLTSWITILALLGLGQEFLNFTNILTNYMSKNSFSIYFVHQTVLITLGFYIIPRISNTIIEILLLIPLTFMFSLLCVEILKRIPVLSSLFGMKK
ncbi:MAG: acyltransferase family protein [Mobilitalea sp.]